MAEVSFESLLKNSDYQTYSIFRLPLTADQGNERLGRKLAAISEGDLRRHWRQI